MGKCGTSKVMKIKFIFAWLFSFLKLKRKRHWVYNEEYASAKELSRKSSLEDIKKNKPFNSNITLEDLDRYFGKN